VANDEPDTFGIVVQEIGSALAPLQAAVATQDSFKAFIRELGWLPSQLPQSISDLAVPLGNLLQELQLIYDGTATGETYGKVATNLKQVFVAIEALEGQNFEASLTADGFAQKFPPQLVQYLIIDYLVTAQPRIGLLLRALGVIRIAYEEPAGNRPAYVSRTLAWPDIPELIKNPVTVLKNAYGWGTANFNSDELFENLEDLLIYLGAPAYLARIDPDRFAKIEGAPVPAGQPQRWLLRSPLFIAGSEDTEAEAGLELVPMGASGPLLPGIALMPYLLGGLGVDIEITPNLHLKLDGTIDVEGGVGVKIRPASIEVFTGFDDPVSALSGALKATLAFQGAGGEPLVLLGQPGASRLEMKSASGAAGFTFDSQKPSDVFVELGLQGPKVVVKPDPNDGFLAKVLPPDGMEIPFELSFGWSRLRGFYFSASAGLEVTLPVHLSILDVINIESIYLAALVDAKGADGPGIDLAAAATVSLQIGPVFAAIDEMGIKAKVSFPGKGGNLGPMKFELGLKPPKGVALEVDASAVTGGGYLFFDFDNEQYAGVLMLSIESTLTLKAVGLITTRMPDGSSGFSMLVIISVEFTPIQLGFGFTLNGVGGLAGIHRTIILDALQSGLRNHSIDNILFPKDPIHRAKEIISDLSRVFPPAAGRYVFGPMVMIGWGNSLLIAELGVILDLPSPFRIVILGQIHAAFPKPEEAIVLLNLDVLGVIDFAAKLFSLDATLHDSRIAMFSVFGDMAMRLGWGDDPSFALSIGGLNPHFQPPPNFPMLRRFTLGLASSDDPKLTIEGYLAITSNTFQTGAKASLYAGAGGFSVEGYLGFDVLFIFDPFSFLVDFSAGFSLKAGGSEIATIHLHAHLSGTSPWHVWGTASISILFFDISVDVDATFGNPQQASLPPADPTQDLVRALEDPRNWSATLPAAAFSAASVSAPKPPDTGQGVPTYAYVDPAGALDVRQKVVPLEHPLTKYNGGRLAAQATYTIDSVQVGPSVITALTDLDDFFAPAQFEDMSDSQKLSSPSFEPMHAGVEVWSDRLTQGPSTGQGVLYETEILDTEFVSRTSPRYALPIGHQIALSKLALSASAPFRNSGRQRFVSDDVTRPGAVDLKSQGFVIASTDTMQARKAGERFKSKAAAEAALRQHQESGNGGWQVVPEQEVQPTPSP
jgi:hypothetical protein